LSHALGWLLAREHCFIFMAILCAKNEAKRSVTEQGFSQLDVSIHPQQRFDTRSFSLLQQDGHGNETSIHGEHHRCARS